MLAIKETGSHRNHKQSLKFSNSGWATFPDIIMCTRCKLKPLPVLCFRAVAACAGALSLAKKAHASLQDTATER